MIEIEAINCTPCAHTLLHTSPIYSYFHVTLCKNQHFPHRYIKIYLCQLEVHFLGAIQLLVTIIIIIVTDLPHSKYTLVEQSPNINS